MYFLRVGDQAVRLLDREQREIGSTASDTLARVTEAPLGGYTSIDPADLDVRAAAEYAVSEQTSRSGAAVVLRRLARAERQVVAGLNYRLCLEVPLRTGVKRNVRSSTAVFSGV
jgi:Aspartic acid proteinase inhibitor